MVTPGEVPGIAAEWQVFNLGTGRTVAYYRTQDEADLTARCLN